MFLLNGALTPVVGTQQAVDDPDLPAGYIPLASGDYVLVPAAHTDKLKDILGNLEVRQGYLVEKDKDTNVPIETRAKVASPDVTYVSLKVTVSPITTQSPAPSPPKPDNPSPSKNPKKGAEKK